MCLHPCEHICVLLLCAGPLVRSVLQTAQRREKKRESLNVTLLSTVTTLATCNVSARISVAHWACAEQAPSPPRAPRKRTRWTRDELGQIPAGGRCNFNHLFFSILCYAECHHSPKLFLLLSSLFALCCPSAIKASTASHDGCCTQGGSCDSMQCPWEWNLCIVCVRDRVAVKLDIKALIAASAVPPHPSQVDSQNALLLAIWLLGWSYF